jgi:hypothetical protein
MSKVFTVRTPISGSVRPRPGLEKIQFEVSELGGQLGKTWLTNRRMYFLPNEQLANSPLFWNRHGCIHLAERGVGFLPNWPELIPCPPAITGSPNDTQGKLAGQAGGLPHSGSNDATPAAKSSGSTPKKVTLTITPQSALRQNKVLAYRSTSSPHRKTADG